MENELYHHGTKGMRWGIRRFQRKDGSLTPAGRKRYGANSTDKTQAKIDSINKKTAEQLKKIKTEGKAANRIAKAEEAAAAKLAKAEAKYKPKAKTEAPKTKSLSEMSDDEIRNKINRIRLEKELASLTPQEVSPGKKFVTSALNNVIAPAAKTAGKNLLTKFLEQKIGDALGLDKKTVDEADGWLKEMAKANEKMNTIKKNDELKKYFEDKKNKGSDSDAKKPKDKSKGSDDSSDKADKAAAKEAKRAEKQAKKEAKEAEKQARREVERELEAEREAKQTKSEPKVETVTGEIIDKVVGKQTSSATKKKVDDWIDAEWSEVPFGNVLGNKDLSLGRDFVYELISVGDDD